ncbi:small GTP-binding protein, putative [Trichomonas vaginalis G3]|uniref:Small GTP-binding protein, putative n=1 Tax=Trichomonas vaginalis (strain ATCC PRA-98 / G3) TaxID=412133 RepID=A2EA53_TRIV3|nr:GTPase protein [Trichomonas vaginalis G3]EAY10499.1 small GTP-binding protein, putative [Trichomonas vaginalis G3]KAI5489273.1 GTPase protein [Trichomonas vaginalis G3]|eukprot:XP_001322722.1 small GTP-binding protein [Trichomonas vaginalis G3]
MNLKAQTLKVTLAGNANAGKTCMIHRLIHFQYVEGFHQTVGTATHDWSPIVGDKTLDIQIYDTAGAERYRSIASIYFREANGAVITYDASDEVPTEDLKFWIQSFREMAKVNAPIVIAANKADLIEDRSALQTQVNKVKEEFGYPVFITSSKTGEGIAQMFQFLAEKIHEVFPDSITIDSEFHENEQPGCQC